MWDNPIDLIIAALNSALEAAINGLAKGLRGIRVLYKKLKILFRVLLVTLLFLFPFLFFLFMGIKRGDPVARDPIQRVAIRLCCIDR